MLVYRYFIYVVGASSLWRAFCYPWFIFRSSMSPFGLCRVCINYYSKRSLVNFFQVCMILEILGTFLISDEYQFDNNSFRQQTTTHDTTRDSQHNNTVKKNNQSYYSKVIWERERERESCIDIIFRTRKIEYRRNRKTWSCFVQKWTDGFTFYYYYYHSYYFY